VTWTQIYNSMFGPNGTSSCLGSSCHTNSRSGFACGTTATACYNGFVNAGYVTPGASASSSLILDPTSSCLCGGNNLPGNMPAGSAACITAAQEAEIQAWLASGAPDN
jgi:hypothetical protein